MRVRRGIAQLWAAMTASRWRQMASASTPGADLTIEFDAVPADDATAERTDGESRPPPRRGDQRGAEPQQRDGDSLERLLQMYAPEGAIDARATLITSPIPPVTEPRSTPQRVR